jgi:hypothetical protein
MPDGSELRASADERKGPDTARSGGVTGQVPGSAGCDQVVAGIQGRTSVSMTSASKNLRPCFAAVDR